MSDSYAKKLGVTNTYPFIELVSTRTIKFYFKVIVVPRTYDGFLGLSNDWQRKMFDNPPKAITKCILTDEMLLKVAVFNINNVVAYTDDQLRHIANELFSMNDCIFMPKNQIYLSSNCFVELVSVAPGLIRQDTAILFLNKSGKPFACPFHLRETFPKFDVADPVNKDAKD